MVTRRVASGELMTMLDRISRCRGVLLTLIVAVLVHGARVGRCQSTGGADPQTGSTQGANGQGGFLKRWADFYRADWSNTASSVLLIGPRPPRRGVPSPLNS